MKLKQIVIDKTNLTLTKEKKEIKYNEVFEVEDEARVKEILAATYKGKPVAELVEESTKVIASTGTSAAEQEEEMKSTDKKVTKKATKKK